MKRYIIILLHHVTIFCSKRKIRNLNKLYHLNEINQLYTTRNLKYKYFHHFFWNLSPNWLQEHRQYFSHDMRGFGEDAFHAMWYLVFSEFKPNKILEIGVYRGQTEMVPVRRTVFKGT